MFFLHIEFWGNVVLNTAGRPNNGSKSRHRLLLTGRWTRKEMGSFSLSLLFLYFIFSPPWLTRLCFANKWILYLTAISNRPKTRGNLIKIDDMKACLCFSHMSRHMNFERWRIYNHCVNDKTILMVKNKYFFSFIDFLYILFKSYCLINCGQVLWLGLFYTPSIKIVELIKCFSWYR